MLHQNSLKWWMKIWIIYFQILLTWLSGYCNKLWKTLEYTFIHIVYGAMDMAMRYSMYWSKSLYRSRAGSNFYGTEIEIWAGFKPVGNTEKKKLGRLWATFEGGFFMFSRAKNIVASALKSCIICISFIKFFWNFG